MPDKRIPDIQLKKVGGKITADCPLCDHVTEAKRNQSAACSAISAHLIGQHRVNFALVLKFQGPA